MIRIARNRCGYTDYECTGTPVPIGVFMTTGLVADTLVNRTPEDPLFYNYVDNYRNLPISVKGSIMSILPIDGLKQAVTGTTPLYPEASCLNNTDPYTATGFMDMFNVYISGSTPVPLTYGIEGSTVTVPMSSQFLPFTENVPGSTVTSVYTMTPGILEPMLSTEFAPMEVVTATSLDSYLDGIMFTLNSLSMWRTSVNLHIADLYRQISQVGALRNLMITENERGPCDQFNIVLAKNNDFKVLLWNNNWSNTYPSYRVTGGTVYIGGTACPVLPMDAVAFDPERESLDFYLNVELSPGTTSVPHAFISTVSGGTDTYYSQYLGSVRRLTSDALDTTVNKSKGRTTDTTDYTLFRIYQPDCYSNLSVPEAGEGLMYMELGDDHIKRVRILPVPGNGVITIDHGQ